MVKYIKTRDVDRKKKWNEWVRWKEKERNSERGDMKIDEEEVEKAGK